MFSSALFFMSGGFFSALQSFPHAKKSASIGSSILALNLCSPPECAGLDWSPSYSGSGGKMLLWAEQ